MPELPEVETIRRQLAPVVENRKIAEVAVLDDRWCTPLAPAALADGLEGRRIARFSRRGKFMLLHLDDESVFVLHLRMTGNLLFAPREVEPPSAHLRGTLTLDGGDRLEFVDPRRFGTAQLFGDEVALDEYFATRLGVEPFADDFTPELLFALSRRRRTPVKAFLLDQRQVAGIGNIYADEALFRAGISPRMQTARLTRRKAELLHEGVIESLTAGIDAKGASIDDFRDAYGVRGSFQDQFLVHRREGLPCPQCDATVIKTRVAGRGTYFCRKCQRA